MSDHERVNCYLPRQSAELCDRLAYERGLSKSGVLRLALGMLRIAHDAEREGRHVGIASDPAKLETLILTPV